MILAVLLSMNDRATETVKLVASETHSLNLTVASWSIALGVACLH